MLCLPDFEKTPPLLLKYLSKQRHWCPIQTVNFAHSCPQTQSHMPLICETAPTHVNTHIHILLSLSYIRMLSHKPKSQPPVHLHARLRRRTTAQIHSTPPHTHRPAAFRGKWHRFDSGKIKQNKNTFGNPFKNKARSEHSPGVMSAGC